MERIVTRLLLPHKEGRIEFNGNLYWGSNIPPQKLINYSRDRLEEKGYWVSCFPEGDGIVFEAKSENLLEIYNDIIWAFDWSDVQLPDNPQSRMVLLDLNNPELKYVPTPGNFYYMVCKQEFVMADGEEYVKITGPDIITGITYSVTILFTEYEKIRKGEKFQVVLRSLPANDREFLISGISTNELFLEEEENQDFSDNADE